MYFTICISPSQPLTILLSLVLIVALSLLYVGEGLLKLCAYLGGGTWGGWRGWGLLGPDAFKFSCATSLGSVFKQYGCFPSDCWLTINGIRLQHP